MRPLASVVPSYLLPSLPVRATLLSAKGFLFLFTTNTFKIKSNAFAGFPSMYKISVIDLLPFTPTVLKEFIDDFLPLTSA